LFDLAEPDGARASEFAAALTRLLNDKQDEVRAAGMALAIAVLEPAEAQGVLARGLGDKAEGVRIEAAGRLCELGRPEARGLLAAALGDDSFNVQFYAARGMAILRHKAGFEVLVQALGDPELRFAALGALAMLGDREALPHVRQVFDKWFLPVYDRTQAAAALAALGDEAGAKHLLARAGKRALDCPMALQLLGEVKAAGAYERLTEVFTDRGHPFRGPAALGLGLLKDPRAAPLLRPVLAEPGASNELRFDVACALAVLGDRASCEAALETFASPEERAELTSLLEDKP
jgi:HEAT repeat protein